MFMLNAQTYLVCTVSYKAYRDMYRISKSRIVTPQLDIIYETYPVQQMMNIKQYFPKKNNSLGPNRILYTFS